MRKFFRFESLGTSYKAEILGGVTTFFAMSYIIKDLRFRSQSQNARHTSDLLRQFERNAKSVPAFLSKRACTMSF